MVDWDITEATIFCDFVGVNVTLTAYEDGTMKCTGYKKYSVKTNNHTRKYLKSKGKELGRKLKCEGLGCPRMVKYKEKLFST